MRFEIPKVDLRDQMAGGEAITDLDTGKTVGMFFYGHQSGRRVKLFDGKYYGEFDSHAECCAFAKGVEAVLNHMVALKG